MEFVLFSPRALPEADGSMAFQAVSELWFIIAPSVALG